MEIDRLVGGLPLSARRERTWWANTWRHPQAQSWLSAGFSVPAVDLNGATVRFVPGSPPRPTSPVTRQTRSPTGRVILDGVHQLEELLRRAGYQSVVAAVAERAVFLHPDTVRQTSGQAVFPTIRDMLHRGTFDTMADGRHVLRDDNTSPTLAFLWAAGRTKGPDVQYNHVWNDSANPDAYTSLWNICATPAFLAKTTDGSNHPDVVAALRHRAWDLYGCHPNGQPEPRRPVGYDELVWAPHPPPVADLEAAVRGRLRKNPKTPALAAQTIGWLHSAWQPDPII
jgi:hypothetical protein